MWQSEICAISTPGPYVTGDRGGSGIGAGEGNRTLIISLEG
jgi:hypothetical protein